MILKVAICNLLAIIKQMFLQIGVIMAGAVKISNDLISKARTYAKAFHRSTAGQIEYWAKIGQLVEENPDLPYHFIQEILIGLEEVESDQLEPYVFGEGKQ